jgi:hypothetical protein
MKIQFEGGEPASADVVLRIERVLGTGLSSSYRSFLLLHDGAKPESNRFDIGPKNGSGVRRFIPAAEILRQRAYIDHIPEKAYPIAEDACGNFILIDEARGGAVLFWDHETDDLTEVAVDFAAFLECLQPFNAQSISLKPDQVKGVWIDPEFRRPHPELFKPNPKSDESLG